MREMTQTEVSNLLELAKNGIMDGVRQCNTPGDAAAIEGGLNAIGAILIGWHSTFDNQRRLTEAMESLARRHTI
jgi:hypothetical protein